MIGRIPIPRPPIIVDLPEMKRLLATSTVFLHSKRRKKIAIHLRVGCRMRIVSPDEQGDIDLAVLKRFLDRRAQKKMPDAFKQSGICSN